MAGFYLIYSTLWKQFRKPEQFNGLFHPIALTISALVIVFLFGSATIILLSLIFLSYK